MPDYEEMNRNLDEFIKSPDYDKFIERQVFARKLEQKQKDTINNYIDSLTKKELKVLIDKVIIWEQKYEEMLYKRYIQGESLLFSRIMSVLTEKGKHSKKIEEDFMCASFKWNGYKFNYYCGQGTILKIYNNNGENIFQST